MEEVPDYTFQRLTGSSKRANAPDLKARAIAVAFVATGSWDKDHKPVIAHSNWDGHSHGQALGHHLRYCADAWLSHD